MLLIRLELPIPQRKVNINVYVTDNKVKFPHKKQAGSQTTIYSRIFLKAEGGTDFPDLMNYL